MSKVQGLPASSFLSGRTLSPSLTEQVGKIIASSHRMGASFNLDSPSEHGKQIIICDSFDSDMIERIKRANDWFKQNQSLGFAHADVHYGNVFIDADGQNVVGLIDFAYSGNHPNPFVDMTHIVSEALPYAQEGYRKEWRDATGIDKMEDMIAFSKLSYTSSYIHYIANKPDHDSKLVEQKSDELSTDVSRFLSTLELN